MALPKLNTVKYELEVPSTGKKLKFRPFLVKEQKTLMIAQESEDEVVIQNALADVISACTFDKIDPWNIPSFDLEYIFLNVRGKSIGELLEISILCPDDMETRVPVKINLEEIEVTIDDEHTNMISLDENIKMVMKYPTLKDVTKALGEEEGVSQTEQMFKMVKMCVNEIHDGETVYNHVDISNTDLEEFIDGMSTGHLEKVNSFFDTMPKLFHTVTVKNPNTEVESEVTLQGFDDFFV
jgi:hypothetical protein|tara:strand:- start:501 stop:1217 length:717 start_codon:yes stop_codon:yes gene_type:complete